MMPSQNHSKLTANFSHFAKRYAFALIVCAFAAGCFPKPMPYHGFTTSGDLDKADNYVLAESIGGKLDPRSMAQEDQRYSHDNIAYDRNEEGYYQWGKQLYSLGYRDDLYIQDLAPRAFRHELLDTYMKALKSGFDDAMDAAAVK